MLALVQVPKHGDAVLAAGCGKRTVRGDRDGVDVAGVAVVVGLQLELGEFPNLRWEVLADVRQKWISTRKVRDLGDNW